MKKSRSMYVYVDMKLTCDIMYIEQYDVLGLKIILII